MKDNEQLAQKKKYGSIKKSTHISSLFLSEIILLEIERCTIKRIKTRGKI
jgi:hypothetical protein